MRISGVLLGRIKQTILLLMFFLFLFKPAQCQNTGQKVSRQTALNSFASKNYEQAYNQFIELSGIYPKDPLYKYYSGVCLVETGKEPLKASSLLNEAAMESGAIRSVPPDCFFYLGRALQMSGKFSEAIEAYNRFSGIAGRKSAKDLDVPELIKECNERKGKVISEKYQQTEPIVKDSVMPDLKATVIVKESSIKGAPSNKFTDSIPAEFDRFLNKALESRIKADSALLITNRNHTKTSSLPDSLKQKIKSNPVISENRVVDKLALKTDSVSVKVSKNKAIDSVKVSVRRTVVFSDFSVKEKPIFKPDEKVTVNPEVPAGLIYRIQIAVFRNPVAPAFFKGITPVQGFRNQGTGITTYYAGRFRRSADADKALLKVRAAGFRDAFVVAIMDKKIISNDRAVTLEKEWGSKPLFTTLPTVADVIRDTVPPTLVFKVEVKRSQKPLPDEQVEAMRKMAGNRGFNIENPEPKQYIYLIGQFFSYKSASEFADLLLRNGYKEAKVVAWLGKREIPVETAKQLFGEQ